MNIEKSYLARWPKKRPELPPENQKVYKKEYHTNRAGASFFSKISTGMEKWMHRKVAAHPGGRERILELGAGTLNHLKFEKNYECYDIVEPFNSLFENSEQLVNISNIYIKISMK